MRAVYVPLLLLIIHASSGVVCVQYLFIHLKLYLVNEHAVEEFPYACHLYIEELRRLENFAIYQNFRNCDSYSLSETLGTFCRIMPSIDSNWQTSEKVYLLVSIVLFLHLSIKIYRITFIKQLFSRKLYR